MEISFRRGEELRRETRQLPAEYFRKIFLLSKRANGNLFVPIRAMQYLAVIDNEEIVFVDGQGPRVIEAAWQAFRSSERDDISAPVSYQCVFYEEKGVAVMTRLQAEFFKALELLETRQHKADGDATVTPLPRG